MRRLVALSLALVALAIIGAGCRHDGREMRPALASQDGTVSTTAPSTTSSLPPIEGDFFDEGDFDTVDTAEVSTTGTVTSTSTSTTTTAVPALALTAPWRDGAPIDDRYTCIGENFAPALSWTAAPAGTQEIAVTMIDQDAAFDHWTMAGIRPNVTSLAENVAPEGAVAALSGAGVAGYTGPCPPAGTTHRYRINVYFLNRALQLTSGGPAVNMRTAIDAATITTVQVTGTFTGS